MSNDIVQIRRKSFDAEARFVTVLNIDDVARWCDGIVLENGDKEGQLSRKFIKVPVIKPQSLSQTEAHMGDWVVRQGRGFKVYKEGALKGMFELRSGRPIGSEDSGNQNRPPKKQHPKHQHKGPNPSQMPKKRTEPAPAEVGRAIDQPTNADRVLTDDGREIINKEIVNPEAAQAVRSEDLGGLDIPKGEDALNAVSEKLTDLTLEGASAEEINKAVQESIGVMDELKVEIAEEKPKHGPATVDATHASVPGAITLDELNAMPGDFRTQTDILREAAEGVPGSEPVLDTREIDDERTPGEVFRGEG